MNFRLKERVQAHWEKEVCGQRYGPDNDLAEFFRATETTRYQLEPEILDFARFEQYAGKKILEIGTGGGVDHLNWYKAGAIPYGIDLTKAAIEMTRNRLRFHGFETAGRLNVGDAENLAFQADTFDLVYSWGVLHHTPDTPRALSEVFRVLKPGGELKALVYHDPSWVALMLYLYHGARHGDFRRSLKEIAFEHLESPGTKTYSVEEMKALLARAGFRDVNIYSRLSAGDLMDIKLSEKYSSPSFKILSRLYPRWLVRLLGHRFGLNLFIHAAK